MATKIDFWWFQNSGPRASQILTLPPDAQREPSGDTVTQFRKQVCPKWLVFRRQLARFHTYRKKIKDDRGLDRERERGVLV